MRKTLWPWWTVLLWMAAWMEVSLVGAIAQGSGLHGAAQAASAEECGRASAASEAPRVISTHWDPVLRRSWAIVAVSGHPDWPAVAVPVRSPGKAAVAPRGQAVRMEAPRTELVVRAGDAVQLWSERGDLRLDVAAIAEQNGGLGQLVRVRLMQRKTLGQQAEKEFTGVVRGPHDVEMQR